MIRAMQALSDCIILRPTLPIQRHDSLVALCFSLHTIEALGVQVSNQESRGVSVSHRGIISSHLIGLMERHSVQPSQKNHDPA